MLWFRKFIVKLTCIGTKVFLIITKVATEIYSGCVNVSFNINVDKATNDNSTRIVTAIDLIFPDDDSPTCTNYEDKKIR